MEDYKKLLELAMQKIPKKASTRDRFEVPKPHVEVQKNKTIIRNLKEIAEVLRREPDHLTKYLSKNLAAPATIESGMLVLQTSISSDIIAKKIESYVKEFVYCKVCGKPDTNLFKEDRLFFMVCEACGAKSSVGKK